MKIVALIKEMVEAKHRMNSIVLDGYTASYSRQIRQRKNGNLRSKVEGQSSDLSFTGLSSPSAS
jgi:hypothetical protein